MGGRWLRRLHYAIRQRQADADVRTELEFHREMKQREVEARGVPVAAAAIAARRAMGNLTSAREDARAVWIWPWLETVWQDTAYAARIMRRQAGSALLAVFLLAVTIGLNTSLMAVLNGLLLRPWPGVGHGRDVVTMYLNESRTDSSGSLHDIRGFTRAHWQSLAKEVTSLISLSALHRDVVQLGPDGTLGPVGALLVSGNFFDTLQLKMSEGRGFQADEDRPESPRPVVVLSDRIRRARLGGDVGIVGRSVVINGRPFTIVGVASPEFGFSEPGSTADLFLPSASSQLLHPGDSLEAPADLVGRLAPGATRERARAELNLLSQQFDRQQGGTAATVTVTGTAFTDHPGRTPILIASALVSAGLLAVWIIACANVGNLLLAQATARGREIGIRLAIGASRPRVVRQLLTEGFIVALAASVLGMALAYTLPLMILRFIAEDATARFPFLVTPDSLVIGSAVLMAALSAVLYGLAPALHATGVNLAKRLGGREGLAFSRVPLRSVLLAIQVAVSVVLLIVAGLLVTGAGQQSNALEADFATDVTVVSFNAPSHAYDAARTRSWMTDLTTALHDLPLSGFALTSQEPFSRLRNGFTVRLPGESDRVRRFASSLEISPGYFSLLRIPFVAGRDLEATDSEKPVAVINEAMARRFWPNDDPIGKTFMMFRASAPFVVIGVTKDVHLNAAAAVEPTIFTPFAAVPPQPQLPKLLFRSDHPGASDAVKRAASRIDPEMSVRAARLTAVIKGDFMSGPGYYGRILAQVLGGFALALATVGMFGVFAYAVRQRTREIGMRMALGARPTAIVRLILLGHSRVVLVGVAVGLFLAVAISIVLRSNLPGVGRFDGIVYAGVGLLLAAAGLAASYLPARRATRINPVLALRCE
jgi:putative ABC transport system permease protein